MLVKLEKNTLTLNGVNDMDYVHGRILKEVAARKSKASASTKTKVVVLHEIDGIIAREPRFIGNVPATKTELESLQKLFKVKDKHFKVNSTGSDKLSVHVTIELTYDSLLDCKGEDIVKELQARFKELEAVGLKQRDPRPKGVDSELVAAP